MLTPRAVSLIIRHIDCLDLALSRQLMRRSVPAEPSLTDTFCGLFDQDAQYEFNLDYPLSQLNADLFATDALVSVNYNITTHPYSQAMEGAVTQADLGLVINYRDFIIQERSWSIATLLQAKRLFPEHEDPTVYSQTSRFRSYDAAQHSRMHRLRDAFSQDFIHYLLYCPRPHFLSPASEAHLAYVRNHDLCHGIFDYTFGQQLHNDLVSNSRTVEAGVFVSNINEFPTTIADVHSSVFRSSWPLSWYVVSQCLTDSPRRSFAPSWILDLRVAINPHGGPPAPTANSDLDLLWAHALVRGNAVAVRRAQALFPDNRGLSLSPPKTLTIDINVAHPYVLDRQR